MKEGLIIANKKTLKTGKLTGRNGSVMRDVPHGVRPSMIQNFCAFFLSHKKKCLMTPRVAELAPKIHI